MIGRITKVPGPGGTPGFLTADNGGSYYFTSAGWRAPSVVPAVGRQVEFSTRGSQAVKVRPTGPLPGSRSAPGSAAGQAQRQSNPPPDRQLDPALTASPQRSKGSRGSLPAALRPMLSIFMVTPLTVPLLFLLPLIGRLELLMMILLAGFLGGRRAGGIGRALSAAAIVGTAHGFVVYFMVLVGLQLLLGLPHAGGYVDAGIGFFGGITMASSMGAVIVALPVFLILLVSSVMGALTARI